MSVFLITLREYTTPGAIVSFGGKVLAAYSTLYAARQSIKNHAMAFDSTAKWEGMHPERGIGVSAGDTEILIEEVRVQD